MTQDDITMECPVCRGQKKDLCSYCGGEGKVRIISLTKAQELLDGNTVICIEPDEMMKTKISDGKVSELWGFNVGTGISGRGDQRFFDVRLIDRGGWYQLVIYEEPGVEVKENEIRVVGHIIIEYCRGIIVVREANGVNGPIFELKPSSVSKDKLAPESAKPVAFIEANPQRIMGLMAVYLIELPNLPEISDGEIYMAWEEFCKTSNNRKQDGRSLAALAAGSVYRK